MTYEQAKTNEGYLDRDDQFCLKMYDWLLSQNVNHITFEDFMVNANNFFEPHSKYRFEVKVKGSQDKIYKGGQYRTIQEAEYWLKRFTSNDTRSAYILDVETKTFYIPSQYGSSFMFDMENCKLPNCEYGYDYSKYVVVNLDFFLICHNLMMKNQ